MSIAPGGIGFVGCGLRPAAMAAAEGTASGGGHAHSHTRRREVVVAGKRVKTVDIHAHCAVMAAMDLIGAKPQVADLLMDDTATRLADMDAQGLDVAALSINPFWYHADRDMAAEVIRIQNEALAEICAATPERFVAFATAAWQHPDLAVEQIDHAVRKLGLRGVSVGGAVEDQELADPIFHPIWAKCEELGLLVFLHPVRIREVDAGSRLGGSGLLTNTIGNPLETTIALSHMIFEGTLDRFPGVKICAAHGGGYLPSYAHRSDAVIRTFPDRVGPLPRKPPTAYLRDGQLFFDSLVFTPEGLRHLVNEVGYDKIMIGTDYPFPWSSTEVDLVLNTPGLTNGERVAILGGTAAGLMGIGG